MPDFDASEDLTRLPGSGIAVAHPARRRLMRAPTGGAPAHTRSLLILRQLDVVLVAIATPVALALGAPVLGYAIGAGAWMAQRIIAQADKRWLSRAAEPRTQLAASLAEAFARIWLLAGAIVIAGVAGGRADGLTAAVTIFGAYSIAFVVRLFTGPPQGKPTR